MDDDRVPPSRRASRLQEAIDTIVQAFDHPENVTIEYAVEGREKRTTFEIGAGADAAVYELVYDGRDEETEPDLTTRD